MKYDCTHQCQTHFTVDVWGREGLLNLISAAENQSLFQHRRFK